ncbi:membrane fusion protein [Pseudomonas gessardii]|uniref:HlyD family efflux transporter periplasmic adaptor subunit n=1 Tax=Pseudomonas gessardii TaxID=78544 RepID=A0A7Y1MPC0_9PSED|nr:HlyD family efflux transporter periplasmic adaptor subunit [Pseudomonas gessardii]MRU50110.1 HlyD family efflux transporter periplasmic adaptor subunit [Pseudomonas gessardii]NNA95816.1 HlyD family efflux transporter periplasmic adaptor subunit [Pseudomonas gessardii]SDR33515.1 membrane fusion protein [Pseudomonas gessardii]
MSTRAPLFRNEVLVRQRKDALGEIILIPPTSFAFLALGALCLAAVVIGFMYWGSYTKRSTVNGQLLPATGQVKVHAPQAGIVLEKLIHEGQSVQRGDPLVRLSSERYGSDSGPVQANISLQLTARRDSLLGELEKIRRLQTHERETLDSKITSLLLELTSQANQTQSQHERVVLATDAARRYQGLMEKGYISMDQLQQRQAELLGQRQTLQGLQRDRTTLTQQLTEKRNERAGLDARQDNQLADIERQISVVEQEFSESEARRVLLITAPEAGIITAALAEVGQTVDTSKALLSIMPHDTPLEAELYAPSRSIGFINPGDTVLIRYQAFPYQKFGKYQGLVHSISRTSISFSELASMVGSVPNVGLNGEQFYRLRIRLNDQKITAYGQQRPLQSGMLLEADIIQDRRRLYEWILEPLYSLTGKL